MTKIREVSQAFTPRARRTLIQGRCPICGQITAAGQLHRNDCFFRAGIRKSIQQVPFMLENVCLGLN